jgi:hypothetical protein
MSCGWITGISQRRFTPNSWLIAWLPLYVSRCSGKIAGSFTEP